MSASAAPNARRPACESATSPVSGSASGASVHGWTTTSGAQRAMTSPVPVPAAFVAKPLMWSLCRWVATIACNLPPHSAAMSSATLVIRSFGAFFGSPVLPKSISTCRSEVL